MARRHGAGLGRRAVTLTRVWKRQMFVGVVMSLASLVLIASCQGAGTSSSGASGTATAPQRRKWDGTAPPVPTLDPALVAQGQQVYDQSCASCHGPNAEGASNRQQPDLRGNLPPPPHDDSGHTWRHGDGELFEVVHDGWRDPFNKTPDITMPAFGETLSDEEIRAVITYLKSLWSEEHRRFQLQDSEDQPFPDSSGGTR